VIKDLEDGSYILIQQQLGANYFIGLAILALPPDN